MSSFLKIGWFTSAKGEGSYGLFNETIKAIEDRELKAEIRFVFVNRDFGQSKKTDSFISLVKSKNIPLVTFSSKKFRENNNNIPWKNLRNEYDNKVISKLRNFNIDFSVHAGYMLIAPILCSYYKTINLHPALPGETIGMWQQAIWDVIFSNKNHTGAMIHISTKKVDEGPVISFCKFSVKNKIYKDLWSEKNLYTREKILKIIGEKLPLFQKIRADGLIRERPLMIETLKAIGSGKISLENPTMPINLTKSIEQNILLNP